MFPLSNFNHQNFPLGRGSYTTSAKLQVTLDLNNEQILTTDINFLFNHNQNPNNDHPTVGFLPPCPNVVSIANPLSEE